MKLKDCKFSLEYHQIMGIESGDENAPVLLFLHGWLDNAGSFLPLIPYLKGYRVIAIDLPGHGFSDHRSLDGYYHFTDWLSDLLTLLNVNKWQSVDIVGHSMGAMIATAFTACFPERVNKLTCIDSLGFFTSVESDSTKILQKGLQSREDYHQHIKAKKTKYYASLELAIKSRLAVADFSYQEAEILVQRNIKSTELGFTWRYDQRLRLMSPYRFSDAQAKQLISDITVPCQLIYGDNGAEMVAKQMEDFLPLFKNIRCHCLPGGHHVHMQEPEQVAALIDDFHQPEKN